MVLNSNIVIITSGKGNKIFIEKFAKLIRHIFKAKVLLITTGDFELDSKNFSNIQLKHISIKYSPSLIGRIKNYLSSQILITKNMPEDYDIFIFFLSQSLFLPMLRLKILKKQIWLFLGASEYQLSKSIGGLNYFLPFLEKFAFKLSNYIYLYSNILKKEWNLCGYENKIKIAHEHFLNFNEFAYNKKYRDRDKIVGYIGRLSIEKGIINFIESMPLILRNDPQTNFLIVGSGKLTNQVKGLLDELGISSRVNLIKNVSYEEIPIYLNQLKLLVLPSYTEGLPNILIESMACGTPVLANSVGSIPELIIDNKTGFILKDNSPECISENVIKLLKKEDMDKIIRNSLKFAKTEFDFDNVSENYETIFKSILK